MDLQEPFDTSPTEIKVLFGNTLDYARTNELRDRLSDFF
jgi:hypothetical protein